MAIIYWFLFTFLFICFGLIRVYRYWHRELTQDEIKSLKGQRVIITGAGSGIGRELAILYASSGARVSLVGRREKELEETANLCRAKYPTSAEREECALVVSADCGKEEDCRHIITTTVNHFGGLDVLVLNHVIAGICHLENYVTSSSPSPSSSSSSSQPPLPSTPNSSSTYDFPSIDQSFQVNVLALIKLTALALPHLRSSSPSSSSSPLKSPVVGIIAISSLASKMSFPGLSVYSSCKAAINAFFNCLRVELQTKTRQEGEREVTATTCCVGMTATEAALQHTSKKAQTRAISPVECTKIIVASHLRKRSEVWFSFDGKLVAIISFFFPDLFGIAVTKLKLMD